MTAARLTATAPPASLSAIAARVTERVVSFVAAEGARWTALDGDLAGPFNEIRRMVEAGLLRDGAAAVDVARAGLDSLHGRMRATTADGEVALDDAFTAGGGTPLGTATVRGTGERATELSLPLHGQRLRGDALRRQLDDWTTRGIIEPSAAEAVRTVLANPDWLDLSDQRVVVLGAGAEMGPLPSLMRWGARVAAVDLDRAPIWERLLGLARDGAGTLVVPVAADADVSSLEEVAGVDLLAEVPSVQRWLEEQRHQPEVTAVTA